MPDMRRVINESDKSPKLMEHKKKRRNVQGDQNNGFKNGGTKISVKLK